MSTTKFPIQKSRLDELNDIIDEWGNEKQSQVMRRILDRVKYSQTKTDDELLMVEAFELALEEAEKCGHQ